MELIPFLLIVTVVLFVAKSVYDMIKAEKIKEQKDKHTYNQHHIEQEKKILVKYVAQYFTWVQEANTSYIYHYEISDNVRKTPKVNDFLNTTSVSFMYQFNLPDFIVRKFTLYSVGHKKNVFSVNDIGGADPLYDEAVNVVYEKGKVSISMIQRRLDIGYNRAERMVEMMEQQGVVSPMSESGQRKVTPNIFEDIDPALEQYYADIRPDSHPENIRDLKSNIEVLFEPKMCVYHLDILFELVNKSKDALDKSINKSQSFFNVRDFIEFWDSLNVVNIIFKELNTLTNMIDVQVKQYRDARKKIITNKLKNSSESPMPNTPSLHLDRIKVNCNIVKEILTAVRSDFDFSSMLQQILSRDTMSYDMSYASSIPKIFDETLTLLESCVTEIKCINGTMEQQSSTNTDIQDQTSESDGIEHATRKLETKKSTTIVDKDSEVVGRKPRKYSSVSQSKLQLDKVEEIVTGRKPRVDSLNGGNSLSGKESRFDGTDVPEEYTGRKPRSI